MKILILDDDAERIQTFQKIYSGDEVTAVMRYNEFVFMLNDSHWDLIHLDHDIGDKVSNADTYVDGWGIEMPFNGTHATMRICELEDKDKPSEVIVHSINSSGAPVMVDMLTRAGIPAKWEPFELMVDELK